MDTRSKQLIRELELSPHPEGGFYREIYRSSNLVQTERGERSALTTILFLLRKGDVSEFHRVASDEVWNFLEGDPLRLISLSSSLQDVIEYRLADWGGEFRPVVTIEKDLWQAAETLGEYTLVSCSVAPGFEFRDFELMRDMNEVTIDLMQSQSELSRFAKTK